MKLIEILSAAEMHDSILSAVLPESWMQGRTAYGGLSSAVALEAVLRAQPELPPLRSAQIAFVGPLAGPVEVTTKLLRRGRTAAYVEAEVFAGGRLGLKALFVFMVTLDSSVDFADEAWPGVPQPEDAAPAMTHAHAPGFTHQLEYRHALPIGEPRKPDLLRWVRLKERAGLDPMVELLAIGDALPPPAMVIFPQPGPVSSMTWMLNVLTPEPATRDGWWLSRSTAEIARGGFSSQVMQLWDASGRPVVKGMQSVALFV